MNKLIIFNKILVINANIIFVIFSIIFLIENTIPIYIFTLLYFIVLDIIFLFVIYFLITKKVTNRIENKLNNNYNLKFKIKYFFIILISVLSVFYLDDIDNALHLSFGLMSIFFVIQFKVAKLYSKWKENTNKLIW